jgi:hypothetical protein
MVRPVMFPPDLPWFSAKLHLAVLRGAEQPQSEPRGCLPHVSTGGSDCSSGYRLPGTAFVRDEF